MRRVGVAPVLAGLLWTSACAPGEHPSGARAWSGTRETVAGVEVVRNPAKALWPSDSVRVERLWVTPAPGDAHRLGLWQRPSAIAVAAGHVYVLDPMAHRFYVIDAGTGRWERDVGRSGGGPGELRAPTDLVATDSSVVVADNGKASIERFGADGAFRSSTHVDRLGFGLLGLGEGAFLTPTMGGWQRIDARGRLTPFRLPAPVVSVPAPDTSCSRVSAARGVILRVDCYRPLMQVIDTSGALRRTIVVDRPAERPPPEALDSAVEHMRRVMARSGHSGPTVQPLLDRLRARFTFDPRMHTVRRDPQNGRLALWEQRSSELGGSPAHLDLFSASGVYLATLDFAEPWIDFAVSGSAVYALVQDPDTDLARLVAYRLTSPPDPSP